MKTFIAALFTIAVIATGAAIALDRYQASAEHAFSTTGVRI